MESPQRWHNVSLSPGFGVKAKKVENLVSTKQVGVVGVCLRYLNIRSFGVPSVVSNVDMRIINSSGRTRRSSEETAEDEGIPVRSRISLKSRPDPAVAQPRKAHRCSRLRCHVQRYKRPHAPEDIACVSMLINNSSFYRRRCCRASVMSSTRRTFDDMNCQGAWARI